MPDQLCDLAKEISKQRVEGTSWFLLAAYGNSGRFFFLGLQITVDGYHSHEIKKCLFLGRKAMAKLDSVSESRDITLPTNV